MKQHEHIHTRVISHLVSMVALLLLLLMLLPVKESVCFFGADLTL